MKKVFLLTLLFGAYTGLFAQNSFPSTGNVLINTSTDNGYQLQVNGGIRTTGSPNIVGNIALLTGGFAVQYGVGAAIVCGGVNGAYPVRFQGPSDGNAIHGFIFEDCYGGIFGKEYYHNGSFVNIHNSFTNPNQNGLFQ